jgi:hypothetical protein
MHNRQHTIKNTGSESTTEHMTAYLGKELMILTYVPMDKIHSGKLSEFHCRLILPRPREMLITYYKTMWSYGDVVIWRYTTDNYEMKTALQVSTTCL